jgi:hypothetical protein
MVCATTPKSEPFGFIFSLFSILELVLDADWSAALGHGKLCTWMERASRAEWLMGQLASIAERITESLALRNISLQDHALV